jgi:hypothetical protein
MTKNFDVFETLEDGDVLWHGAANTLSEAQQVAQGLATRTQNPFFVLQQSTRQKFLVHASGATPDQGPSA